MGGSGWLVGGGRVMKRVVLDEWVFGSGEEEDVGSGAKGGRWKRREDGEVESCRKSSRNSSKLVRHSLRHCRACRRLKLYAAHCVLLGPTLLLMS